MDISSSRSDAKRCPECRVTKLLSYMVEKRRAVRKCRACKGGYRCAGEYDMSWCASCLQEQAESGTLSPSMARMFRGTVARCDCCGYSKRPLLAMDARVPLCIFCAKSPDGQASVLLWLKDRQAQRKRDATV